MKKMILITVTRHGFYSGIESVERVVVAPEIARDWIAAKILADFYFSRNLNGRIIEKFIETLYKFGSEKSQIITGWGDYEVSIIETVFIESLNPCYEAM